MTNLQPSNLKARKSWNSYHIFLQSQFPSIWFDGYNTTSSLDHRLVDVDHLLLPGSGSIARESQRKTKPKKEKEKKEEGHTNPSFTPFAFLFSPILLPHHLDIHIYTLWQLANQRQTRIPTTCANVSVKHAIGVVWRNPRYVLNEHGHGHDPGQSS
jgi:hypothetical protein